MPVSIVNQEDNMAMMSRYPDKYFDLAVVDPPYGVGDITYMPSSREYAVGGYIDKYEITVATVDMNQRTKLKVDVQHSGLNKKTIKNFGDENVSPSPLYFKELLRVSKHQIIWGGNYFLLPPSRGFLIWRKLTISESFSMAMCEFAWMSFNQNAKWIELAPQGSKGNERFHPTQKPVELYKWCLNNYANQGDKILDTHLGSGSSRIAAYDLGFDFYGCELDKDYYEAQEKRFATHIAQQKLFAPVQAQVEQTNLF